MIKSPAEELQDGDRRRGAGGTGGENVKPKRFLEIVVSTDTGLGSDGHRLGVL